MFLIYLTIFNKDDTKITLKKNLMMLLILKETLYINFI